MATKAVPRLLTMPAHVLPNTMLTLVPREAKTVQDGIQELDTMFFTRLYTKLPFTTRTYKAGKFIYPAFTRNVVDGAFDVLDEDDRNELTNAEEGDSDDFCELEDSLYDAANEYYKGMPKAELILPIPDDMRAAVTVSVSECHGLDLHICLANMSTGTIYRLPTPNTYFPTGIMCTSPGVGFNTDAMMSSLAAVDKYFDFFEASEWSIDMIESAPVDLALDLLRWNAKTEVHSPAPAVWRRICSSDIEKHLVIQDSVVKSCVQATKVLTRWRRNI